MQQIVSVLPGPAGVRLPEASPPGGGAQAEPAAAAPDAFRRLLMAKLGIPSDGVENAEGNGSPAQPKVLMGGVALQVLTVLADGTHPAETAPAAELAAQGAPEPQAGGGQVQLEPGAAQAAAAVLAALVVQVGVSSGTAQAAPQAVAPDAGGTAQAAMAEPQADPASAQVEAFARQAARTVAEGKGGQVSETPVAQAEAGPRFGDLVQLVARAEGEGQPGGTTSAAATPARAPQPQAQIQAPQAQTELQAPAPQVQATPQPAQGDPADQQGEGQNQAQTQAQAPAHASAAAKAHAQGAPFQPAAEPGAESGAEPGAKPAPPDAPDGKDSAREMQHPAAGPQASTGAPAAETRSSETLDQPPRPTADPDPVVRQVTRFIKVAVDGRQSEVRLQLHPEHLGTVAVKLIVGDGVLKANLITQDAAVKAALEANLDQLKSRLADQGLTVEQVHVAVGGDGSFSQPQHSRQGDQRHSEPQQGRFPLWQGRQEPEAGPGPQHLSREAAAPWRPGSSGARLNSLA